MRKVFLILRMSLVSAVILTALVTATMVVFGFPHKPTTTDVLFLLAGWFVVSVVIYTGIVVTPRQFEPRQRHLYQLVIGKHNMGLFLTKLEENEFRELIVEYMVKSDNELSMMNLVEYLKKNDSSTRPISYRVVGIVPKIVT